MGHDIRYTRPETRSTITRVFVPDNGGVDRQVRRLVALGYTIIDVQPSGSSRLSANANAIQSSATRGVSLHHF